MYKDIHDFFDEIEYENVFHFKSIHMLYKKIVGGKP